MKGDKWCNKTTKIYNYIESACPRRRTKSNRTYSTLCKRTSTRRTTTSMTCRSIPSRHRTWPVGKNSKIAWTTSSIERSTSFSTIGSSTLKGSQPSISTNATSVSFRIMTRHTLSERCALLSALTTSFRRRSRNNRKRRKIFGISFIDLFAVRAGMRWRKSMRHINLRGSIKE